jgi:hypothetical protein
MVDYSSSKEQAVKLDYKPEQTLHEIKSSLKEVVNTLDNLSKKVENLDKKHES